MTCSLGILCEPLRALGLHSHRSAAKKSTAKRSAKKPARKTVAKKSAAKKKRK